MINSLLVYAEGLPARSGWAGAGHGLCAIFTADEIAIIPSQGYFAICGEYPVKFFPVTNGGTVAGYGLRTIF